MLEELTDEYILANQNKYRYWQFEKLKNLLLIASLILGIVYILLRQQSLALTLLLLLIAAACVGLDICFPAYFTLLYLNKEMEKNARVMRISLMEPFFGSLGLLAVATYLNMYFVTLWKLLLSGVVYSAVLGLVFLWGVPECRRNLKSMGLFMILLAATGFGITGQANYWLDSSEPDIVLAVVEEVDSNTSYRLGSGEMDIMTELLGTAYTCTLQMPDGTNARFTIRSTRNVLIGAEVPLDRRSGALGLEYYCLRSEKMNIR